MDFQQLTDLIRSRRAIFPKNYDPNRPISREIIERLLENANWAPTHKNSQPWRFKIFHSPESRQKLGEYLLDWNEKNKPNEPLAPEKRTKILENPRRSAAVIALCIQPNPTLPEWEEVAALACAVQNMWLSCAAQGIGAYWSSPKAALEAHDFLKLAENERCFGLFYLGWPTIPALAGKRDSVLEKTVWW
jgi:nitroreductase